MSPVPARVVARAPGRRAGPIRTAILMRRPVQHFAAGLRLLAAESPVRNQVYYWEAARDGAYDPRFGRHLRWHTDLHSGYDWWAPPEQPAVARLAGVWRRLRIDRPEVILCFGWASPIVRAGIAYAKLTGTPLLYYGDSNPRILTRRPRLRGLVLRHLFRGCAGAVSTGAFNREFYLAHGLAPDRVLPGVYPIELDGFAAAGAARPAPGTEDRPLVFGFAGKFIAIKAASDLIEAVARLPRERAWELWLIGDGPLREQLVATAAGHGIAARTRFLGFRNTDELPALMAGIDVMVMPSHQEPRGLVPIEAMAAGAAAVVSSATGVWGPGDAIAHGRTGLVYPVGDIGALAGWLHRLLDDGELRHRLAQAGRERALAFGPRDFAATVAAAFLTTTRRAADARRA